MKKKANWCGTITRNGQFFACGVCDQNEPCVKMSRKLIYNAPQNCINTEKRTRIEEKEKMEFEENVFYLKKIAV